MKYFLDFCNPTTQLIHVTVTTHAKSDGYTEFHLPRWRPGRYTMQSFEKNITDLKAQTLQGQTLPIQQSSINSWKVYAPKGTEISLTYSYFANKIDGGSTYLDDQYIYVNGITLFLYTRESIDEPCSLTLNLPQGYQLACSLPKEGNTLYATSFHQLVDAPFFSAKILQHHTFEAKGIKNHLWFMGECKPDFSKIATDIKKYTETQINLFGEFPVPEYHYLFIMRLDRFRHGVEHYASTVIVMGPGYQLMNQEEFYDSFLAISSHELFHTWNVKQIRPIEMLPYKYDQENYTKLHYITEGVTTYYGDLMLWKSGVWSFDTWLKSFNNDLKHFFQSTGKQFISLEHASYNSWVNGYGEEGVPNRKISFYTKGCVVSFLLDFKIRETTSNKYCLDHVLHALYHRYAKHNQGYTKQIYKSLIEEFSGVSLNSFFEEYIEGKASLINILKEAANFLGLELHPIKAPTLAEEHFGFRSAQSTIKTKVTQVLSNSPAQTAGFCQEDEIISIEGIKVSKNIEDLLEYFEDKQELEIFFFRKQKLRKTTLRRSKAYSPGIYQYQVVENPNAQQLENRRIWATQLSLQKQIPMVQN